MSIKLPLREVMPRVIRPQDLPTPLKMDFSSQNDDSLMHKIEKLMDGEHANLKKNGLVETIEFNEYNLSDYLKSPN